MVHIVDGVLSGPVVAAGTAVAVAGVALGLRRMDPERLPQVAVLGAAFFVASLIRIPLGPSSAHLMFNGLTGLLLGWAAFPAILVALVLQAVMFGFGGITVLGVNTAIIAVPALASYWLFGRGLRAGRTGGAFARGAAAGALAIAVTGVLVALALALTGREFLTAAELVLLAHLPVMGLEALVTGAAVALIARVKPELLVGGHGAAADPLPVPDLPAAEATAHEKSRHG